MKVRYRNLAYLIILAVISIAHGIALSFAPIHNKLEFGLTELITGVVGSSVMAVIASTINLQKSKPIEYWETPSKDVNLLKTKSPLILFLGLGIVFIWVSTFALVGYFIATGSISYAYIFFGVGGIICIIAASVNYLIFSPQYKKYNKQIKWD